MRYTSMSFFQICLKFLRLAVVTVTIALASHNSRAEEMPEGMYGWWYFISVYEIGYAPDAVTACKLTAKNHMNKELGRTNPEINAIGANLTLGSAAGMAGCGCRK